MPVSRIKLIFGFLLTIIFLNACSGNNPGNSNTAVSNVSQNTDSTAEIVAQDNIEELSKIIKLPFTPEEATYAEINASNKNTAPRTPAPNDKKLVAVLRFSAEDAAKIAANAEKYKTPVAADVDAETWFPPELVARSQETGDEFLKGSEYSANDFIQPPYINGKLTRINDTNYFILELTVF